MKKTHVFYYVVVSIVCLFFSSYVLAQTSMVTGPTQAISKTLIVLVGIVALIIGLAWLSKFFGVNNLVGHKDIKAIAQIPLGQREKAVLIDVYGKKILLGIAPGSVNTLHVFDDITSQDMPNHIDSYKNLLPREYEDNHPLSMIKDRQVKSSKKSPKGNSKETSREISEFSSFIKKIMSNGNANQ